MWARGEHAAKHADSDVIAENGTRLEVKFAQLNSPYAGATTKRWSWQKILGEMGNKKYDRLILIGKKDPRYADQYGDEQCPWVIFDVPYSDLKSVTISSGRWRLIQLTTNPRTAASKGSLLYRSYKVTAGEVEARYRE